MNLFAEILDVIGKTIRLSWLLLEAFVDAMGMIVVIQQKFCDCKCRNYRTAPQLIYLGLALIATGDLFIAIAYVLCENLGGRFIAGAVILFVIAATTISLIILILCEVNTNLNKLQSEPYLTYGTAPET